MNAFLPTLLIALAIAVVDIIPMILKKLPRHTTIAAFFQYFFVSAVIIHTDLGLPWWIQGGVVGLALMIPMLIHVAHEDKKPVPIIATNAFILGVLAGVAGHFFVEQPLL